MYSTDRTRNKSGAPALKSFVHGARPTDVGTAHRFLRSVCGPCAFPTRSSRTNVIRGDHVQYRHVDGMANCRGRETVLGKRAFFIPSPTRFFARIFEASAHVPCPTRANSTTAFFFQKTLFSEPARCGGGGWMEVIPRLSTPPRSRHRNENHPVAAVARGTVRARFSHVGLPVGGGGSHSITIVRRRAHSHARTPECAGGPVRPDSPVPV